MAVLDLRASLVEHSRFFDHLVELVPARFYNTNEEENANLKYMKKDVRQAEKKARKIKARAAKRAKLDPDNAQTALDMQKAGQKSAENAEPNSDSSDASSEDDDSEDDDDAGNEDETGKEQESNSNSHGNPGMTLQIDSSTGTPAKLEELRAKLQSKLQVFRQNRKAEQRQDSAKKAKEWRDSALKKEKSKSNKTGKKRNLQQANGSEEKAGEQASGKPHAVSEPQVQLSFGQLVFGEEGAEHKKKKQKKPSKAELLQDAEKKAAEKQELQASADGQVKLKKEAWSSALSRAKGEKILDDPKLLRKSLKKEEKLKEKKSAAWKKRSQVEKKTMKDKQKKRRDNLNKRIQDNKKRKIEKREKKLMRPGFEGRRDTSIN